MRSCLAHAAAGRTKPARGAVGGPIVSRERRRREARAGGGAGRRNRRAALRGRRHVRPRRAAGDPRCGALREHRPGGRSLRSPSRRRDDHAAAADRPGAACQARALDATLDAVDAMWSQTVARKRALLRPATTPPITSGEALAQALEAHLRSDPGGVVSAIFASLRAESGSGLRTGDPRGRLPGLRPGKRPRAPRLRGARGALPFLPHVERVRPARARLRRLRRRRGRRELLLTARRARPSTRVPAARPAARARSACRGRSSACTCCSGCRATRAASPVCHARRRRSGSRSSARPIATNVEALGERLLDRSRAG